MGLERKFWRTVADDMNAITNRAQAISKGFNSAVGAPGVSAAMQNVSPNGVVAAAPPSPTQSTAVDRRIAKNGK